MLTIMKIIKLIGILFLALVALMVMGQILPRPAPPPPGKIIKLPSGVFVNTYAKGTGQTIVLTHGLPGSADDWIELVDALVVRGFHVVWYDRVGYGHSSRRAPDAPHTMQINGQELDELIAVMGLGHPALVGWSFGGGTVQTTQTARHNDTPFIVLMAAVGSSMRLEKRPTNPPGASIFMRTPILGKIMTNTMATSRFNDQVPDRWMKTLRPTLLMEGALATMDAEMLQMKPSSLDPSGISTPALVIQGRMDKLVPYAVGVDLSTQLPNAKLLTMDKAGHMLPMSYPEQVADAIKAFSTSTIRYELQPQ